MGSKKGLFDRTWHEGGQSVHFLLLISVYSPITLQHYVQVLLLLKLSMFYTDLHCITYSISVHLSAEGKYGREGYLEMVNKNI